MVKRTFSKDIVTSPVVVLTGAGASAALGKPTTYEFMETVEADFLEQFKGTYQRAAKSAREKSDDDVLDVEVLLQRLRESIDLATALQEDSNFAAINMQDLISQYEQMEDSLHERIVDEYSAMDSKKAMKLYRPFWDAFVRGAVKTVPLFTLNYDIAIEQAFNAMGSNIRYGIQEQIGMPGVWTREVFDTYRESDDPTLILFKLHGSVSWARKDSSGPVFELPADIGRDPGTYTLCVRYPYFAQKDIVGEPYRTNYDYFEACLKNAKVLLIIGCSLRDEQVTSRIAGAIGENPRLALRVMNPSMDSASIKRQIGGEARIFPRRQSFLPETSGVIARSAIRRGVHSGDGDS